MAQARGFSCDAPDCKTFETAPAHQRMPMGWIEVIIPTYQDNTEGRFELCSNKCMMRLAKARIDAEKEATPLVRAEQDSAKPGRQISDEGRKGLARGGKVNAHKRFHGPNNKRADCEYCQGEPLPEPAKKSGDLLKPEIGAKAVKVGNEWLPPLPTNGRKRLGHRTQHVDKNVVNPDCIYCQHETAIHNTQGETSAG